MGHLQDSSSCKGVNIYAWDVSVREALQAIPKKKAPPPILQNAQQTRTHEHIEHIEQGSCHVQYLVQAGLNTLNGLNDKSKGLRCKNYGGRRRS
eukprot:4745448-Amphidinium_carterae.2